MEQSPGRIYLADQRGFIEDEVHRRYSTFNFQECQLEHRQPFGRLHTFNDEILPAGGRLSQVATVDGYLLLVPITGAISLQQYGLVHEVEAGQVMLVPVTEGRMIELINPFTEDWVSFLYMEIHIDELPTIGLQRCHFDFEDLANQMIQVIPPPHDLPFSLHMGRFAGREEMIQVLPTGQSAFAFVIGGAFELQNRLLHERDGLALWETDTIDAEALSNDAVLLLLILY